MRPGAKPTLGYRNVAFPDGKVRAVLECASTVRIPRMKPLPVGPSSAEPSTATFDVDEYKIIGVPGAWQAILVDGLAKT